MRNTYDTTELEGLAKLRDQAEDNLIAARGRVNDAIVKGARAGGATVALARAAGVSRDWVLQLKKKAGLS